jgi:hypothetical protein
MWAVAARLTLLPAASASAGTTRAIASSAAPRDLRVFLDQESGEAETYGGQPALLPTSVRRAPSRAPL